MNVRDPGCAQIIEIPFVYCLYRYAWYLIFCVAHGHPMDRCKQPEFINAKIRADHYDFY